MPFVDQLLAARGIGGSGGKPPYDFGKGVDGVLNTAGNVTLAVGLQDGPSVIKKYSSITINAGHVLTVDNRCRGLILYSEGDVVINGTIDMSQKSPVYFNDPSPQPLVIGGLGPNAPIAIKCGGRGGNGGNGGDGNGGTYYGLGGIVPGSGWLYGGAPGGGGGGGAASANQPYKRGGDGSTPIALGFAGGARGRSKSSSTDNIQAEPGRNGQYGSGGGGGGSDNWYGTAYSASCGNGGAGGSVMNGFGAGGGCSGSSNYYAYSGNPGGDGVSYGGGTVIIVAKGNIIIGAGGKILANGGPGANGGSATGTSSYSGSGGGGGGGGCGGGVVYLIHKGTYTNNGTIQVNGGNGGTGGTANYNGQNGGAGGIGVIETIQLA